MSFVNLLKRYNRILFIVLLLVTLLPQVTPAIALFMGLALALVAGQAYPKFAKKTSKYLLQASVVGLGFGMNLHESLASGKEILFATNIYNNQNNKLLCGKKIFKILENIKL